MLQSSYDNAIAGPRHKIPWIEYNGQIMSDSQLIINYLNKEFNVSLNSHLTPRENATAWAIQKWLEEFTYWYESSLVSICSKHNVYCSLSLNYENTHIQIY